MFGLEDKVSDPGESRHTRRHSHLNVMIALHLHIESNLFMVTKTLNRHFNIL